MFDICKKECVLDSESWSLITKVASSPTAKQLVEGDSLIKKQTDSFQVYYGKAIYSSGESVAMTVLQLLQHDLCPPDESCGISGRWITNTKTLSNLLLRKLYQHF